MRHAPVLAWYLVGPAVATRAVGSIETGVRGGAALTDPTPVYYAATAFASSNIPGATFIRENRVVDGGGETRRTSSGDAGTTPTSNRGIWDRTHDGTAMIRLRWLPFLRCKQSSRDPSWRAIYLACVIASEISYGE